MAGFVEELSKYHLWRWLEIEKGWDVYSEVQIEDGRVDLAGVTPEGDYIGVELKSDVPDYPSDYYGQLSRYIESRCFDKVYFASHDAASFQKRLDRMEVSYSDLRTAARHLNGGISHGRYSKNEVLNEMDRRFDSDFLTNESASLPGFSEKSPREYVACRLGASTLYDPVDLDRGMKMIQYAQAPQEIGVIKVPIGGISINNGTYAQPTKEPPKIRDPQTAVTPDEPEQPTILKPAASVSRQTEPEFPQDRDREPYVQYQAWLEFTGIPEASIPNTMNSDQGHRPIDVLSFSEGIDPVEIRSNQHGELIGIEAKGVQSYRKVDESIAKQLTEYAESGGLSRLFLAVPEKLKEEAMSLVQKKCLNRLAGLITVQPNGTTKIIKSAPKLDLKYDSYIHKGQIFRLGYDELSLPNNNTPNSAYIHELELERLKNKHRRRKETEIQDIQSEAKRFINNEGRETEYNEPKTYDGYLPSHDCIQTGSTVDSKIRSYLLARYSSVSSENQVFTTRMTLHSVDNEYHTNTFVFSFDNYIKSSSFWLVDQQIEFLVDALSSSIYAEIETLDSGLNMNNIKIMPVEDLTNGKVKLSIEAARGSNINVILTPAQWKDLLVVMSVLREHSGVALPEEERTGSYPRIGPNGNDTWDLGRDVEGSTERGIYPDDMHWPQ